MENGTIHQQAIQIREEIESLFFTYGNEDYDGEPVSQASHMIQCGMQAIHENAGAELVIGAFLHDIGHLLRHQQETEAMGTYGVVNHEGIGAAYLQARGFSPKVCAVVEKHVDAKRYLVATDPAYKGRLSLASQQTLIWQGGPMSEEEVKQFRSNPFYKDIIRVRLWDEEAKKTDIPLLPLSYFMQQIEAHLERNLQS